MSSGGKSHSSLSKNIKVCCRIKTCKEQVLIQNYERHLARYHPHEDSKDLSTYGQTKFSFFKPIDIKKVDETKTERDTHDIEGNISTEKERVDDSKSESEEGINSEAKKARYDMEVGEACLPPGRKEEPMIDDTGKAATNSDLDEIEGKADLIIEKLQLTSTNLEGNQVDRLKKKLDLINASIKLSDAVCDLEKIVKEVKKLTLTENKDSNNISMIDEVKKELVSCRSVEEIENKVPEFQYDEKIEKVVCQVCGTDFQYDISQEQGRKQSTSLVDLKNRLKYHILKSAKHKTALQSDEARDKICQKENNRNLKCGMCLARTSYYILNSGRPTKDFTELLSMQHSNGCDIGDLNHSFNFVDSMAGSFSKVIMKRVKRHLSTRLPQTGCLPPCKVVEDGATYRHNTRHLIGVTSLFPGDNPLLQSVFLGAPKGVGSDGLSTAKSMADTVLDCITQTHCLNVFWILMEDLKPKKNKFIFLILN